MVGGRSGGRGKCQTRTIVWRAASAYPNGLNKARFWVVHRSGAKWGTDARKRLLALVL